MTNQRVRKGKIDGHVLQLLQNNPYLSQKEISERLGVVRGTVSSAISRLEKEGSILGSGFILSSPDETSFQVRGCFGFVLISNAYKPEDKKALERILKENYLIGVTHMITGGKFSYFFSFFVTHNSQEFLSFIEQVRELADTETHLTVTCF